MESQEAVVRKRFEAPARLLASFLFGKKIHVRSIDIVRGSQASFTQDERDCRGSRVIVDHCRVRQGTRPAHVATPVSIHQASGDSSSSATRDIDTLSTFYPLPLSQPSTAAAGMTSANMNKRQQVRNERALQDLLKSVPGNDKCAECGARNPGTTLCITGRIAFHGP